MVIKKIVRDLLIYVMLLVTVAAFTPVHAQVAGATLSGTVTDATGSAVPNAKVSIKNNATGVVRDVATDSAGFYSAPNLLPGVYDITVVSPGFSFSVQRGLTLSVGASKALNIALQVGQVSEKVEVTASAPAVELTSSTISGEVDSAT
jgi:Carboxypeptidase regulatory-like domain